MSASSMYEAADEQIETAARVVFAAAANRSGASYITFDAAPPAARHEVMLAVATRMVTDLAAQVVALTPAPATVPYVSVVEKVEEISNEIADLAAKWTGEAARDSARIISKLAHELADLRQG
jgi:hypothetical protein